MAMVSQKIRSKPSSSSVWLQMLKSGCGGRLDVDMKVAGTAIRQWRTSIGAAVVAADKSRQRSSLEADFEHMRMALEGRWVVAAHPPLASLKRPA